MQRSYDREKIEKAKKKRTLTAVFLILIGIPLVIAAEVFLFHNRHYMVASHLILFLTMLPFFLVFEKRKLKARELVLIAMMCALTVAVHLFCTVTIPIKAGSAMIIIAGISLGPETGFLIGALSRFILNFYLGQGPWTPWEMFCWGILGLLAGLIFQKADVEKLKSREFKIILGPLVCILAMELLGWILYLLFPMGDTQFFGWRIYVFGALGLILGGLIQRKSLPVDDVTLTLFTFFSILIVYGGIMNICALVTGAGFLESEESGWKALKILYISGVPYDVIHAGTAAIFMFLFGDKIIRKLERIKIKYGIYRRG